MHELCAPFQIINGRVTVTYEDWKILDKKIKEYSKQKYLELAPIREAEREARFQEYYKSLELTDEIEIPCVFTYRDGREEEGEMLI
jgi:hypothetical protein